MGSRSKSKTVFREKQYSYVPTSKVFRRQGEKTHGQGRHKAKRPGDRLSFKVPRGRRTGTVIESHREYYIVDSKGTIHKVNRQSILYSLGTFAGKVRERYKAGQAKRETKRTVKRQRETVKTRRRLTKLQKEEGLLDLKLKAKRTRKRVRAKRRQTSVFFPLLGPQKKPARRRTTRTRKRRKKTRKRARREPSILDLLW